MIPVKVQDYPDRVVIELTPQCNLSCPMCPRKYIKEQDGYISQNLWIKLINEIAENSPASIVIPFWRGEALLHPDFCNLIESALQRSLRLHLATNGADVDNKNLQVLAKCEFVTFSAHTVSGYNTAKKFLDARSGKHPVTQISFVEGENTMEKICPSIIKSHDLEGFDSVRIYAQHSKGGVFGSIGKKVSAKRTFCPKLQDTLVIAYDGKISRCNHIWETEEEINVKDVSIREAWVSRRLQLIRESYPDPKCKSCDQWLGHTFGESWRMESGKIKHERYDLGDR